MARVERARPTKQKTVAYAVGSAVLVLLFVAGLVFTNSARVARVIENAKSLHWANATMGTAALTRAGLVQAVTFSELEVAGLVDEPDVDFAMDQLSASVEELEHLFAGSESRSSYPELARFVEPVEAALEDLESGDMVSARHRVTTEVETSYMALVDVLEGEQARIQAAIDDNSEEGRAVNGWIVFITTLAIPGSAVVAYFVIARRQMRALEERSRLEIEAERAIGRAKDRFIAGLSHELRTPLTSIYGFAEMLADSGIRGNEATTETAEIIAKETAEMTRMVDDLLVASRLQSTGVEIEPATIDITQTIDAAVTPHVRAGSNVGWEPRPTYITTDAARLKHVLVNLLSNAVRHGGPSVGVEVTEGDGTIAIEVWDDGPGVPEEMVGKLFDPYVHDDDAPLLTGSIGLGLAVASRLTALLGGRLEYQRYNAKTYFVVTLPSDAGVVGDTAEEPESVADVIRALSP